MRKPEIRCVIEVAPGDEPVALTGKPDFNHGMENGMNTTQWQTTLAPIVAFLAGLAAAKLPFLDLGTWTQVIGWIVGIAATALSAFVTKQSSLISTVSNMDDVKTVTLAASAPQSLVNATPANVTK